MIQCAIEYTTAESGAVLYALSTLGPDLRPLAFAVGEDEPGRALADQPAALDWLAERKSGYFLRSAKALFDMRMSARTQVVCSGSLQVEPATAKAFMLHMAAAMPSFGFACAPAERSARNRVETKQGMSTIESWVGRDSSRYVPGLYWLTLMSDALAVRHGVSLAELASAAIDHLTVKGSMHLFQFHERPEEWTSNSTISRLISRLPGVFDVRKVKPQIEAAENFAQLSAVTGRWR